MENRSPDFLIELKKSDLECFQAFFRMGIPVLAVSTTL